MTILDISVIIIFAFCIFIGYRRGLVLTLYSVCGWMLALFLARQVYPFVNKFLLNSFVYDWVYSLVESNLHLDELIAEKSITAQNSLMSTLNLPAFIIDVLQSGNNPVLYELFKASNIAEYIYAYLTVICINILSMILAFIIISLILRAILRSLRIVTRLPVIRTLNKIGGIAAGALQGLFICWIGALVITVLVTVGAAPWLGDILNNSVFANKFVNTNILTEIIFGSLSTLNSQLSTQQRCL